MLASIVTFVVLAINTAVELSQYILNDLEIGSTILSLEMKLFIYTPCELASKQDTNSASIVEQQSRFALHFSKIQLHHQT